VAADRDAAAIWYQRAALQGHTGAIAALTSLRVSAGASDDEMTQVFRLWLRAAEQGDAAAQRMVGDFYMRGVGTPASMDDARRWLTAAAVQGHVQAMLLLGGLLLQLGAEADQAQAVDMFRRAAAQGNLDAQYNLGVCVRLGLGLARDDAEAERLYRAAADQGHRSAQLALGSLIEQRAASEPDWIEAARWYRLAADAGHPAAMSSLAHLYEHGRGVSVDRTAALALYRQALAAGHVPAGPEVRRIEEQVRNSEYAR
jgi:hypothetical protein